MSVDGEFDGNTGIIQIFMYIKYISNILERSSVKPIIPYILLLIALSVINWFDKHYSSCRLLDQSEPLYFLKPGR